MSRADLDLQGALAAGGPVGAVVELLTVWWGVELASVPRTALGALEVVRSPEVHSALGWRQDTVLDASSTRTVAGAPVFAVENQFLWEAFLEGEAVRFAVDDGQEVIPESMALGELLLRLLAVNAAFHRLSGVHQLRCRAEPGLAFDAVRLLDAVMFRLGTVQFGLLTAGRGWLGAGTSINSAVEPAVLMRANARWSRDWEQLVKVRPPPPPPGSSPWNEGFSTSPYGWQAVSGRRWPGSAAARPRSP